jgi:3-oxoacyl-[acyl-carrier protein] reductase
LNILVTGGASGLGGMITRQLAAIPGNKVFFTFHQSAEKAAEIEKQLAQVKGIHCDFSKPEDVEKLCSMILDFDLDVLINNAIAGMTKTHFHKTTVDTLLNSFTINVFPTLQITQKAILSFRKKKFGKIITILSSYLANLPPTGLSEYVANKAYLHSMSKSWARESAKYNITSNCVSPSMMRTQLTQDLDERVVEEIIKAQPLRRLVTPEEVADTVLYLVGATQQINGVNLLINGGNDVI